MRARHAAAVSGILLAFQLGARAEEEGERRASPAPPPPPAGSTVSPPGPEVAPPSPEPLVARPYLFLGAGGGLEGVTATWVCADVGVRVARVTARFAWRKFVAAGGSDVASLYFPGGRLGYLLAEDGWWALHGAAGGGVLGGTASEATPPSSVIAGSFEAGVLLWPRWPGGAILELSVETIVPLGPGGPLGTPVVGLHASFNPLWLITHMY